jgi:hypothetical protein
MPIAKKMDIPQDFLNQMKSNLKKSPDPVIEDVKETPVIQKTVSPVQQSAPAEIKSYEAPKSVQAEQTPTAKSVESAPKEKYADVMNIRLSKGRRNEIKAFCTNNGVTITQYIESSFEFFAREVAAGNISISKGGITKIAK